jgi:hypothetical protein
MSKSTDKLNASQPMGGDSRNAYHHAQLLMSVAHTKRVLCVGHTKLYELIGACEIETVKQGSKTCIVVASAVAYVERLRAAAKARAAAQAMALPESDTTSALPDVSERQV